MYLNSEQQGLNQVLYCSYTGNSTQPLADILLKSDCPVQVRLLWYKRSLYFCICKAGGYNQSD
ncbi:hypothetical protein BHC42_06140 [Snodgrassella alvi]|nr:hypothetical protein BHC50_04220 [Snodgrassella alvi]PIT35089.1 hypothetical protein BHC42_06140 [Snodgrassella alvi]